VSKNQRWKAVRSPSSTLSADVKLRLATHSHGSAAEEPHDERSASGFTQGISVGVRIAQGRAFHGVGIETLSIRVGVRCANNLTAPVRK
jgi:hypothetical protein